jgi:hypothetical protein
MSSEEIAALLERIEAGPYTVGLATGQILELSQAASVIRQLQDENASLARPSPTPASTDEVTEADRQAANEIGTAILGKGWVANRVAAGECDGHWLVQALTAHRRTAVKEMQARITTLEATQLGMHDLIEQQRQEIERLREALKPFAYAAFEADGYPDSEAFTLVLRPDDFEGLAGHKEHDKESLITARHLRRAQAALEEKP